MKKIINEFKEFIARGNVLDLAVGVMIGAAFQSIINSVVNDLISPIIGAIMGSMDFSKYTIVLRNAVSDDAGNIIKEAVTLNYGNFITTIINFLIVAICIFTIVKIFNAIHKKTNKKEDVEQPVTTKICPYCKSEIDISATRCAHCTSNLEQ